VIDPVAFAVVCADPTETVAATAEREERERRRERERERRGRGRSMRGWRKRCGQISAS
jgi:hypothetical protein